MTHTYLPGEYDGLIFAAAVMPPYATITVASRWTYRAIKLMLVLDNGKVNSRFVRPDNVRINHVTQLELVGQQSILLLYTAIVTLFLLLLVRAPLTL